MTAKQTAEAVLKQKLGIEVKLKAINPTPFINRKACKNFLLEQSKATRANKFKRVSAETLLKMNTAVRVAMIGHVRMIPSVGKTL